MANLADSYLPITDISTPAGNQASKAKTYIGSADSEDDQIVLWTKAAIEQGDLYLENDFTDDDGNDLTIPTSVELGIWEWVKAARDQRFDGSPAVTQTQTNQLSETKSVTLASAEINAGNLAARRYWRKYVENVWLKGDSV